MSICLKGNMISVSLISLSHHLWWLVMSSYAFTSLTPVWCEVNIFLIFSFYIFICYLLFSVFFVIFLFIFLVIQSDLEQTYKKFDGNFHCAHVLIVKDYGKLGILYDEKLGGFIWSKKKAYPHNGRQAFSDPLKNECY